MTYKNEKKSNENKPHYGGAHNAAAPYQRPIGAGTSPNATKHCPTCACGAHSQGGLESEIYKALGGMGGNQGQPNISININYFLTPDMIGAYGQDGNYGAGQGAKILPYNAKKKDNDSYGKERNYGRKAA